MTAPSLLVEPLEPGERDSLRGRHRAARSPEAYLVGAGSPSVGRLLDALTMLPSQAIDDLATALGAEAGRRGRVEAMIEALGRTDTNRSEEDRRTQVLWNVELRVRFLDEVETLASAEIARRAHSRSSNSSALAWRWRHAGIIFGVPIRGEWRYPAFQFDPDSGRPRPVIGRILATLAGRLGDWGTALWFTGPNGWLEGARPIDRLGDEESVLRAARAVIERPEF